MKGSFLARTGLGLAGVLLGAFAVTSGGPGIGEARADDAATAGQGVGVTGPTCILKGTSPITKGTQLFDAQVAGRPIANFAGGPVPMQMSEIPADPVNGRAKIVTSTGSGAVRIEGYIPASAISVFTTRDLPVTTGNVWISSAQKMKLIRAAQDALTAELIVAGSRNQGVRATTSCDAFALQRGTPTSMEVPPNGRGYLTKEATIELFDRPNGDVIFTLLMLEGSSQLFWSTETKAGFVHVRSRADLALDGWIRWKELDPLKKGEMMDQYIPSTSGVSGAQLAIDKPPPVRTATREIPIRLRRDDKAKPIGVVEVGAEIYVMETIAGWSNILPKSLHVVPPDDGGFWIPASEAPPL